MQGTERIKREMDRERETENDMKGQGNDDNHLSVTVKLKVSSG